MRTTILFVLGALAARPAVVEAQPSTSATEDDEDPIDDDTEAPDDGEPDDGEPEDGSVSETTGVARDPSAAAVAPLAAVPSVRVRYPRAVIDRPAILPFGFGHAGLDVEVGRTHRDALFVAGIGLPLGSDLHVGYATAVTAGDPSRLAVDLGVRLLETRTLGFAWRARVERPRGTDDAGAAVTGARIAVVAASKYAAWLRAEQLAIDLDGGPVTLGLPLSIGVQLTPQLWMQADADVRLVQLVDRELARREVDIVPAAVGAILSLAPGLDLRVRASGDLGSRGWIVSTTRWLLGFDYVLGG